MRRVVVGIDGTSPDIPALAVAAEEARRRRAHLDVVTSWTYPPISAEERRLTTARQVEDDAASSAARVIDEVLGGHDLDDPPVGLSVVEGAPAKVLVAAAQDSDLLVVGRRDHARMRHLLLGSVADQCVRHAPCPTMVVPRSDEDGGDPSGPIIVGIDGSPTSLRALVWAIEQARLTGCAVRAVYCFQEAIPAAPELAVSLPSPDELERRARRELDAWLDPAEVADEVDVDGVVRWGDAPSVLAEEAAGARMVVVGSRGRGGFAGLLLGSVSRRMVHVAPVPVVVIRH